MVSLPLVQGVSAIQLCSSGMLANKICSGQHRVLGICCIRQQQLSKQAGRQKKEETNCGWRRESVGEKGHRLPHLYIKLSTPVIETATHKSDFLVSADVQNTDVTYVTA